MNTGIDPNGTQWSTFLGGSSKVELVLIRDEVQVDADVPDRLKKVEFVKKARTQVESRKQPWEQNTAAILCTLNVTRYACGLRR